MIEDGINEGVNQISKFTNLERLGMPEAIIMSGLGLAVLLFGYRIKKIAFFIIWFLLGFNLVMMIMPFVNQNVEAIATNELYQTLLPIGGGLLLALLGFSIEKLCVGGICFALVMLITAQYFGTEMQTLAIGAIVGVIAAGLAVTLMKPAIIVATAVAGAYALTLAVFKLNETIDFETFYWPMLIGLSAVGSIFQFLTTRRVS